jgi:hypothetical protein
VQLRGYHIKYCFCLKKNMFSTKFECFSKTSRTVFQAIRFKGNNAAPVQKFARRYSCYFANMIPEVKCPGHQYIHDLHVSWKSIDTFENYHKTFTYRRDFSFYHKAFRSPFSGSHIFICSLFPSFWENESRLMRTPCCLCWNPPYRHLNAWTNIHEMYIMAPELMSTAGFINPSHQSVCLYVYPLIVARQRLSRHVPVTTNCHVIECDYRPGLAWWSDLLNTYRTQT